METIACSIGGLILVASSLGLAMLKQPQWLAEDDPAPLNGEALARGSAFQRILRRCTNLLLGITGALIVATGFVPHGRAWMLLWGSVLLAVFVALVLAGLDACTSLVGYRRAIPEVARRSFSRNQ